MDAEYFVESNGVQLQIGPLIESDDARELWGQVGDGGTETPRLTNSSRSDEIAHVRELFQDEKEKFQWKVRPVPFHFNCLLLLHYYMAKRKI